MKDYLANLNWWAVSSVLFLLLMAGLLAAPAWAAEWAYGAGFTAVVSAVFALASGSLPGPRA